MKVITSTMNLKPFIGILFHLWTILFVTTDVLSPPVFRDPPTWPEVPYYDEDGPPFTLKCSLVSYDDVKLLWTHDDVTIQSTPNVYLC